MTMLRSDLLTCAMRRLAPVLVLIAAGCNGAADEPETTPLPAPGPDGAAVTPAQPPASAAAPETPVAEQPDEIVPPDEQAELDVEARVAEARRQLDQDAAVLQGFNLVASLRPEAAGDEELAGYIQRLNELADETSALIDELEMADEFDAPDLLADVEANLQAIRETQAESRRRIRELTRKPGQ